MRFNRIVLGTHCPLKRDTNYKLSIYYTMLSAIKEIRTIAQNLAKIDKVCHTTFMESMEYPIRINKYLAMRNYATRRGADDLISKKHVTINGRFAVLGDMVQKDDIVAVKKGVLQKRYTYLAYYKPQGIITHSPQGNERSIAHMLNKKVSPIGRLDKNSHGLMILSDDGRITDKLLNPARDHEKEYLVKTKDKLRSNFARQMEAGVTIEDYTTKPCKISVVNDYTFKITLTEGKKHQIKRMVVALHNEVVDLKRIRIMNIILDKLQPNQWRVITGDELEIFLKGLGL